MVLTQNILAIMVRCPYPQEKIYLIQTCVRMIIRLHNGILTIINLIPHNLNKKWVSFTTATIPLINFLTKLWLLTPKF